MNWVAFVQVFFVIMLACTLIAGTLGIGSKIQDYCINYRQGRGTILWPWLFCMAVVALCVATGIGLSAK